MNPTPTGLNLTSTSRPAPFNYDIDSFISTPRSEGKPITLDSETSLLPPSLPLEPTSSIPEKGETLDHLLRMFPEDMYRYKTTMRQVYDDAAERGRT